MCEDFEHLKLDQEEEIRQSNIDTNDTFLIETISRTVTEKSDDKVVERIPDRGLDKNLEEDSASGETSHIKGAEGITELFDFIIMVAPKIQSGGITTPQQML